MKTFAIRMIAVVLFAILEIAPGSASGKIGGIAWSVALSLVFAFSIIRFTGSAPLFILTTVVSISLAIPLALAFFMLSLRHQSMYEGASILIAALFGHPVRTAFRFLLPTVLTAVSMRLLERVAQRHSVRDHNHVHRP